MSKVNIMQSETNSTMADCCNTCGKADEEEEDLVLSYCQKCRSVAYCSTKCQKRDFENHRQTCKRRDAAGTAPCDNCHDTEKIDAVGYVCLECGRLACMSCIEPLLLSCASTNRCAPCPNDDCRGSFSHFTVPGFVEKLENLINQNVGDPRRSQWLVLLGEAYWEKNNERKAMMWYGIAGSLGFAKGYLLATKCYARRGEWGQVKESLEKAADLDYVIAMESLCLSAMNGYITIGTFIVQEDHRGEPDWEEAYYWAKKGAQLGHPACCNQLVSCYLNGHGVAKDRTKAFKWSLKGAEMGSRASMNICASFYEDGYGVEQSNEKAIEWLEKALELENREEEAAEIRGKLEILQARRHLYHGGNTSVGDANTLGDRLDS